MRKMTSNEIRSTWYRFFEGKGHKKVESAPLVPIDDDSLLWINAGVTPLKKYFDGTVVPDNRRIVNIQKCIRTNDIENVGVTKRHQTFFEMMGNFSIGDYFKEEAIEFAYELLTSDEYFAIPKEKLYVTIYTKDEVARQKWIAVGMDPSHIVPLEENFWEIGEGPCGPDSEIFFDRGEEYDPDGDALARFQKDEEQERYVEIWNNVFSQFNAKKGLSREEYPELPSKNIDTGAGLERWACIFQGVDSNFDTDLFVPIINHIEELSGVLYNGEMPFKVIADHIRAITMALSDGAVFENVGRGYVLRRLLRRSVRMGKKIGLEEAFMYRLVDTVVDIMKDFYPNTLTMKEHIKSLVLEEETLFHKTLSQGEKRLEEWMENAKDHTISGKDVFKLYDTYGFPYELTLEYLEEAGFTTSKEEFDACMEEAKQLAKSSRKTLANMNRQNEDLLNFKETSVFFYDKVTQKGKIIALFSDSGKITSCLDKTGYVILDKTCFYAESGGQVADTGMLIGKNFKARVIDVQKTPNGQNLHQIKLLDGIIQKGDAATCNVDAEKRRRIEANHSSVHLLQYALQTVISDTIKQAGSKVDESGLRFDFTYTGKLEDDKIIEVEKMVNHMIQQAIPRVVEEMTLDQAKELGAMALFSEKYGDIVRVVRFDKSIELCGGCHIKNTEDIKRFAVSSVESKGSNVYRIEAVTADLIEDTLLEVLQPYNDEKIKLLMKAKEIVKKAHQEGMDLSFDFAIGNTEPISYQDILWEKKEVEKLQNEVKVLEKNYHKLKEKVDVSEVDSYLENKVQYGTLTAIVCKVENQDISSLKSVADELCNRLSEGFVFLVNVCYDRANIIVKSNSSKNAGAILKEVLKDGLGNGGGSATFAQGGMKDVSLVDSVLEHVTSLLGE